jgi:hypothetical protein
MKLLTSDILSWDTSWPGAATVLDDSSSEDGRSPSLFNKYPSASRNPSVKPMRDFQVLMRR